jgi:hypothetical protein
VSDAKIPLHYSHNKEELFKRMKHEAAIILGSIMCFKVWEVTPESAYKQVRQDPGNRSKLDRVIEEDAVVVWKRPISFKSAKEVQRDRGLLGGNPSSQHSAQLRPSKDVKEETFLGEILEEDKSTTIQKMSKIADKVLSAQDRGGKAPCATYAFR